MSGNDQDDPRTKPNQPYSADGPYDLGTAAREYNQRADQRRADHESAMGKVRQIASFKSPQTPVAAPDPPPKPKTTTSSTDHTGQPFWKFLGFAVIGIAAYALLFDARDPAPAPPVQTTFVQETLPSAPALPLPHAPETLGALTRVSLSSPLRPAGVYHQPSSARDIIVGYGCDRPGKEICQPGGSYLAGYALADGRHLYTIALPGFQSWVWLAPVFGGDYAAAADDDHIEIYDLLGGRRIASFPVAQRPDVMFMDAAHNRLVTFIDTPDKHWLITVHDWQTNDSVFVAKTPAAAMPSVHFSGDGKLLFVGDHKSGIRIFDTASGKLLFDEKTSSYEYDALGTSGAIYGRRGLIPFQSDFSEAPNLTYSIRERFHELKRNYTEARTTCDLGASGRIYSFVIDFRYNRDAPDPDRIEIFDPRDLRHVGGFDVTGRPQDYSWVKCVGSSKDGDALYLSGISSNPSDHVALFRVNARSPAPAPVTNVQE